jgi:diaminopimelate decarboxylase
VTAKHFDSDFTAANYQTGELHVEDVPLSTIADSIGTPAYIYSKSYLSQQYRQLSQALKLTKHRIHYSVKANSNLAILALFKSLGAGFDIVSAGELSRVLAIGGDPESVIFSGVGKSKEEIDFALKAGIGCFNVESRSELLRIITQAEILGKVANVAVRVNPNVDAKTHPYIATGLKENKFGVTKEEALALYLLAAKNPSINLTGIDCHIGSQINEPEPLLQALSSVLELTDALEKQGISLTHVDIGGGFGIRYQDETPLDIDEWGASVGQILGGRNIELRIEPGRFLTANAGLLLTRVEYLKISKNKDNKNFAIVDAAMNDLLRPSLYQAWHGIVPIKESSENKPLEWDVVGPICESGDFLAKQRALAIAEEDLVAVLSTGAYGAVLASNYNTRGRAPEVLVDGSEFRLVRRRETIQDQLRLEAELSENQTHRIETSLLDN